MHHHAYADRWNPMPRHMLRLETCISQPCITIVAHSITLQRAYVGATYTYMRSNVRFGMPCAPTPQAKSDHWHNKRCCAKRNGKTRNRADTASRAGENSATRTQTTGSMQHTKDFAVANRCFTNNISTTSSRDLSTAGPALMPERSPLQVLHACLCQCHT